MSNVLITVLGTNEYLDTYYYYQDQEVKTKYIQQALLETVCKGWHKEQGDRVVVLLTEQARSKNYIGNKEEMKLQTILQQYPLEIEEVRVEVGASEDELWQIFSALIQCTKPYDQVILDITHSLRNIPMQAMVALNHTRVVSNIDFDGIYYGAYEVGEVIGKADNGKLIKRVPIFNLGTYIEIMDWTQAVHVFLKTGNAISISEIYAKKKAKLVGAENKEFKQLTKVIEAIQHFSSCIQNNRGKKAQSKKERTLRSIELAAKELYIQLEKFHAEGKGFVPLEQLFKKIQEKVKDFIEKDYIGVGMATTKWCIEYQLIQQGYTALQETMKTYMCHALQLPDEGKDYREKIAACILNGLTIPDHKLTVLEPEVWQTQGYKEKYGEFEDFIKDKIHQYNEQLLELGKLYHEISDIRNDISHFGFINDELRSYKAIKEALSTYYKTFQKILEFSTEQGKVHEAY